MQTVTLKWKDCLEPQKKYLRGIVSSFMNYSIAGIIHPLNTLAHCPKKAGIA